MSKTINIPAYYIDLNAGLMLLKDLENLYKTTNSSKKQGYSELVIRVTLLPSTKPMMDNWQFALLIVGVMLITSIIAICKFFFQNLCICMQKQTHIFFSRFSCFTMSYVANSPKSFIIK
jgi:hypothetical protein